MLAGPILRHATDRELVFWLVGSGELALWLRVWSAGTTEPVVDTGLADSQCQRLWLGERACLHLMHLSFDDPLPENCRIEYDIGVAGEATPDFRWIADWAPHLCRAGKYCPDFVVKSRVDRILHGSCRRPHHQARDGLLRVDAEIDAAGDAPGDRPALLLMTGDQIYADDVAGPMLRAIHSLIAALGLYHETLEGGVVADSEELLGSPFTYYEREQLLPDIESNEALTERFFGGVRKPVFTAANAHNHLITFSEVIAMYLLVWSPVCWRLIRPERPELDADRNALYEREEQTLQSFIEGLPGAARAMAHVPCYMIFDDHDVTDDWNLSALWEESAYGHPFSRRVVGNALLAYLLCQGWGNGPEALSGLMPRIADLLNGAGSNGRLVPGRQDEVIDELLGFEGWHYCLQTRPMIVVLDTRTRRWRSEINRGHPSGLMDWEALTDFQQAIIGQDSVIVVSAAPVFGVKLIEVIQKLFTLAGQSLMVDAENWMAHRGAASVLLNIFAHSRTPRNFVLLSGDVHYSFAYDVRLRYRPDGPRIWQITSSGICNEFPNALLEWLDRLNRWLYAPWSPLNWFTKRRRMRITPRLPEGRELGERLWNHAGIGEVILNAEGEPTSIRQLNSDGGGTTFRLSSAVRETPE